MKADWTAFVVCQQCGQQRYAHRRANGTKEAPVELRRRKFCSRRCRGAARAAAFTMRFWSKVKKTPTCWTWVGSKDDEGYGYITVHGRPHVRVHRLAWELATGEKLDSAVLVCHHCDNPACVRFEHLFKGDVAANNLDKKLKGRASRLVGERNPTAKLTWKVLKELRRRRQLGMKVKDLAAEVGVHTNTLSRAFNGRSWS